MFGKLRKGLKIVERVKEIGNSEKELMTYMERYRAEGNELDELEYTEEEVKQFTSWLTQVVAKELDEERR